MSETLKLATNPVVWAISLLMITLVLVQTGMFVGMAQKYVKDTGVLTKAEVGKALRVGTIATVGPAIAVFTVAIVLIGLIGGPITLSRVGIIGSAAFESLTANAGSGNTLGKPEFTPTLLATATWVMAIGGAGWLISTLLMTKPLDSAQEKFKMSNPRLIALVGAMAPFMVFFVMGYEQAAKGIAAKGGPDFGPLAAVVVGAAGMWFFSRLAKANPKLGWMGEWAIGFALILAIFAGVIVHSLGG